MSGAITGEWFVTYDDGTVRRSMRFHADGRKVDVKMEAYGTDEVLKQAKIDRDANTGKQWGGGQVIGRLPLPLYFTSGLAEAAIQKDDKFIRSFWNDPDHKLLRTFEGNI